MILVIRVCGNTSEFHIHLPISLFLLLKNEVSSQKQCYLDYRSYFLILINFNWRIITLQYCSYFCHTLTWVSHGCTCVPHPEPPSHLPPHPIPQGRPSAPALSALSYAEPGLVIYFTYGNIHVSMLFSQISPSPSPTESNSLFFTSVSLLLSHI